LTTSHFLPQPAHQALDWNKFYEEYSLFDKGNNRENRENQIFFTKFIRITLPGIIFNGNGLFAFKDDSNDSNDCSEGS